MLPELPLVKNIKLISIVSKAISEDQTTQSSSNNPWLWYHSFAVFSKGEIPVFEILLQTSTQQPVLQFWETPQLDLLFCIVTNEDSI